MRYEAKDFVVWKEGDKIRAVEPALPIEEALYWRDAKEKLSEYINIIPPDANVIQAENAEEAIRTFIEYEKEKTGQ
jgi:hypothetical protein